MYSLPGVFVIINCYYQKHLKIYIDLKKDFLSPIIKGRKSGRNKTSVSIHQHILNVFFIDILDILHL